MRVSTTLVLASTNRHKFEEFSELIKKYPPIHIEMADRYLRNTDKIGRVETFSNYLENASAKARLVNQGCHYPTLADDTGLEVLFLDGSPGIRSHRFAPPKAGMSQDQANRELLLEKMRGQKNREARFVCELALVIEGILVSGRGEMTGSLLESPRGNAGFGYDSLFLPQGSDKTFAEMSSEEKNQISHRAKAMDALMVEVRKHGIVFARV